jgi:hypothetical protein
MTYKTIAYLNSKWWYRLLKIIYILTFIAVISVISVDNMIIYTTNGVGWSIDSDKTLVKCQNDNPPEPFSIGSIGVNINKSYFNDYGHFDYTTYILLNNDYAVKKILISCLGKDREKDIMSTDLNDWRKASETQNLIKRFDITPQYIYFSFFKHFVLTNILIIAILETLRRIFYYVVLGRFKPPKC